MPPTGLPSLTTTSTAVCAGSPGWGPPFPDVVVVVVVPPDDLSLLSSPPLAITKPTTATITTTKSTPRFLRCMSYLRLRSKWLRRSGERRPARGRGDLDEAKEVGLRPAGHADDGRRPRTEHARRRLGSQL